MIIAPAVAAKKHARFKYEAGDLWHFPESKFTRNVHKFKDYYMFKITTVFLRDKRSICDIARTGVTFVYKMINCWQTIKKTSTVKSRSL